jgi:hypothetical protein
MPWMPGQSGNRSGRPKGFAGVAAKIMQATGDGDELISFALGVLRNTEAPLRERVACLTWLGDRSLGRPLQSVDLHASVEARPVFTEPAGWEQLTPAERVETITAWRSRLLTSGDS